MSLDIDFDAVMSACREADDEENCNVVLMDIESTNPDRGNPTILVMSCSDHYHADLLTMIQQLESTVVVRLLEEGIITETQALQGLHSVMTELIDRDAISGTGETFVAAAENLRGRLNGEVTAYEQDDRYGEASTDDVYYDESRYGEMYDQDDDDDA